jgi:hypothetical protein
MPWGSLNEALKGGFSEWVGPSDERLSQSSQWLAARTRGVSLRSVAIASGQVRVPAIQASTARRLVATAAGS